MLRAIKSFRRELQEIGAQHARTLMPFCEWHDSIGPVHKEANHVPKAVSNHDPLPHWVRDMNYVRSQELQPLAVGYAQLQADYEWTLLSSSHLRGAHA